jgi:hypothetical protein
MIRSGANGLMPLGEDPVDVASSDSARSDPDVLGSGTSEGAGTAAADCGAGILPAFLD